MAYILAIDLGSTQMKLMIMDRNANTVLTVTEKYSTLTTQTGWLEQKPEDWEKALQAGVFQLKEKLDLNEIEVISFSGHMSGVVLLDCKGEVLYPCIMLSDSRSQNQSKILMKQIGEVVKLKTGNPVNNAFSLPKLLWLKEKNPEIFKKAAVWISPKDYLRFCLTEKIVTDYTDAYNSLCVNQTTLDWDEEIIRECGLNKNIFPPIYSPFDIAGKVTEKGGKRFGLKAGIPVVAGGADMACAALGMGLSANGDAALTLGTCATFLAIVPKIETSCYGQVTFHPHVSKGKMYALGSHFNGGAAVNWMSSLLSEEGKIDYVLLTGLSEKAAAIPAGSNGLMTIPFLAGSGSPYFCSSDRQHIIGMKINTTREEVFRSQLEGITYNLNQSLLVLQEMAEIKKIMLAGGGVRIRVWPEIIKNVFGMPIEIFDNPDVSTVGAAIIGGTTAGIFDNAEKIAKKRRKIIETKNPEQKNQRQYQMLYNKYLMYYDTMHTLDLKEQNE